jgi:hypothetical protein
MDIQAALATRASTRVAANSEAAVSGGCLGTEQNRPRQFLAGDGGPNRIRADFAKIV